MESEAKLAELIGRMRSFEADHAPDGWPAVNMRDITALCDAIVARSEVGALHLLARVREALGDNGTRMQDELLGYCRELRDSAGALAALGEDYDALKAERDRYRAALAEMSDELSHYPEGDGIFGHLKRILRRALA